MASDTPEATNIISFSLVEAGRTIWTGTASCPHGTTQNLTYLGSPGVFNHSERT